MASTSYQTPMSCSHLHSFKENHGITGYKSLRIPIKPSKNSVPRCSFCSKTLGRLYICLICSEVNCSDHFFIHIQSNDGHEISVDVERSELYCFLCNDQVYDLDFDKFIEIRRKRTRKQQKLAKKEVDQYWGLRGMNNLGNTCFMNSVLQALVHTPPLKNHFLGHREVCRLRRRRRRAAGGAGEVSCLACDLDGVFSAVFSGERMPYSPAQFLYSWWQHSTTLAGYEQQDAHEFFISMLDRIHEKEQPNHSNKGIGDCHCIVHKVFAGILRSDVTCTICGFTSTTYDPCVDISLDLEPNNGSSVSAGKSTKQSSNPITSTLMGCLDHFTRPEKLGSDQKLHCQNCQIKQDSVKQMSIRKLPLVLCFHIKRFEHSLIQRTSKKINQYVKFPFSLDMTSYLSSSIIRKRFGTRIFAFEGDESEVSSLSSEFEIFAVVSHMGQMESGHYVTYLRLRDQWYRCDDAWITKVDEEIVKASQAYVMYYVQKVLYHKEGTNMNSYPSSRCC
ncbi:ubiquitin carboxyl-terminal hydrolase 22-like isoform X2 [Asparagus officinalis]|uniref:ubiquitin carboxyl-terminal hydrolase 22-like isoform X2 n=1 Tax=Asparagus officinalis TaxID=4686 RepID=UPI00098E421E|nr:ubiquitin carboxyl-terminal hydrolase 22-like isoform X2 [Asparagus officinalis]